MEGLLWLKWEVFDVRWIWKDVWYWVWKVVEFGYEELVMCFKNGSDR